MFFHRSLIACSSILSMSDFVCRTKSLYFNGMENCCVSDLYNIILELYDHNKSKMSTNGLSICFHLSSFLLSSPWTLESKIQNCRTRNLFITSINSLCLSLRRPAVSRPRDHRPSASYVESMKMSSNIFLSVWRIRVSCLVIGLHMNIAS